MMVPARTLRGAFLSGFLLVQAYATEPSVFPTGDACSGYSLCDRLPAEFNVSGGYILMDRQVYCEMEEGRWTTLLRRGVNEAGIYVDNPKESFNQKELQDGFGNSTSAEYFLGVDKTMESMADGQQYQLRVDLTDTDEVKYFSVFNNIRREGGDTLVVSQAEYHYGNAGDGDLTELGRTQFNYACTPAGWWAPTSTAGEACSAEDVEGPFLTGPLKTPDFRGGRYAWPTLPKTLKAITLSIRTVSTINECDAKEFAFPGEVLERVTMTMNNLSVDSSFSITCKDGGEVIPTIAGGNLETRRENSVTFTCGRTHTGSQMNRKPAISDQLCMKNCTEDQGLSVGGREYHGTNHGDPTCLALGSGTVTSLLEAAKACGEADRQLLDHLVPETAIEPRPTENTEYWLNTYENSTGETLHDAQGNLLAVDNPTQGPCVKMTAGPQQTTLSDTPCDTTDGTGGLNYICKTQTACKEKQLFYKGFCYESVTTTASSHLEDCALRGGSPTSDLDVIQRLLEQEPSREVADVIVGIYKRIDKFWRPGGNAVEEFEFEGGFGAAGARCAALTNNDLSKLRAVRCDATQYTVFCQSPGYASAGESRCSVPPEEFADSSAEVPAIIELGDDWSKFGSKITASCPAGYGLYVKGGPPQAEFTCKGLKKEWSIDNTVDGIEPETPPFCVLACDLPTEEDAPANSHMTANGTRVVHTCNSTLRTESGATQQQQTCGTAAPSWEPPDLQPCNYCLLPPFAPGANSTLIRDPADTPPQDVGTVVHYQCKPGLTTPDGSTEQTQNCTVQGWVGDIVECTLCEDLPFSVVHAMVEHTDTLGFGEMYNFTCLPGLVSSQMETQMLAVCSPDGWQRCQEDFNCTHCTGSPPNVTGMDLITWNWDESSNQLETVVTYTCSEGLGTATLASEQTANCTSDGWQQDILPCDHCLNPPAGNDTTIGPVEERGSGTLGSSLVFPCAEGLLTEELKESITSVCSSTGWSHCEEEIRCPQCAPLPDLRTWNATLTWDYSGDNTFGTVVTLTCNPGTATRDTWLEVQTVVCDVGGWNISEVLPCTVCNQAPPNGTASMQPVQWTIGVEQVEYFCRDELQLPWNATSYTSLCTAAGWDQCVPECSHCRPEEVNLPHVVTVSVLTNATAVYNCSSPGIQTANGSTVQELTCTEEGWIGGPVLDCDTCTGDAPEAAGGQNRTWDGSALLEASASYLCTEGLVTAAGETLQTATCTETGWTEPPASCDHCPLPDLYEGRSDWTGNSSLVPQDSEVVFTCPNGSRLLSTNSSQQSLTCGDEGWTPELEQCVACVEDIPEVTSNGTDARNVTWDGGRQLGDSALYVCLDTGLEQVVACDNFQWTPSDLGSCVLPTQLPPGEITFPPLPPFDPRYPATTNYYWGTIEKDMEENAAGGAFITGNGPLGFDTSLKLDGTGCMSQQNWAHVNDPCAKNPADCEEGFSFSLWVRLELEDVASMFEEDGTEAPQGPKRYLLSTGGDDSGHPGVAIYLQSHSLSALVSTGDQYWLSSVTGLVRNNTWNNIGVRWSKEGSDGMEAGGLQLLINNSTEGYTVVPEASKEAAKSGLNPGEVMVGCHRTAGNMAYRHKTAAEFDEVAMWTRPLADNETLFFLGGFDSDDKDLDMEKLRIMFKKCVQCRENPVQFKAFISKALVSAKTAPEPASPTVPSTASAEGQAGAGQQPEAAVNLPPDVEQAPPEKVEKIKSLAMLMYDLTDSCKSPMGQDELKDFLEIGALLDETMEMKTLSQWRTVEYSSKEDGGAATVVTRLEKWALDCSSHMVMQPKDRVFVDKQLNNMEMQVEKMKTFNFQEIPIITYPRGKDRRELNTVSFTPELFEQDQECRFVDMSTMFMRYDTYGRISPKRASLIEMDTSDEEMLEVDGQVLSMQVKLNGDLDGTDAYKVANCTPSEERLRTYPVLLTIGHSSPRKALRKPLFHQDEINTGILRRVCVWWNPELSDYGSWDADGCTAIESNEYFTKCRCAHFGQYAIMIEKVPPKVVEIEYQWLQIIKYVCYTISALLLLIFIIAVAKIKQLHEMFHLMRLQTALGLLVGSVFMCMTDIPEIRDSRHACVAFGAIIQVFYLVATMMVMMEGLADFLSMTTGAIGGKLKSYTAISWGVPPLSLGYAFLMYLHDYGTDPRCMLGWPDNVKLTMFVPMMVAMTATAILTALVTCNMQASKLRKENIVAEQLTVCKGYVFFAFFFVVTWVVGVLAYLQLGLQIPSFYPLFQILNSTNGIVFFLFCGVGSERFRLLLTGKAALRRKMLLSYTVSEQLPPAQQPQEEPPRPPTPPEAAPYDPEARAPRKPLVA